MRDLNRFLERNQSCFHNAEGSLFVNPPTDAPVLNAARLAQGARYFFQDYAAYQSCAALGPHVQFGAFPDQSQSNYREIILSLPREKALLEAWSWWTACALSREGLLWLAGENQAGIRSAARHLRRYFAVVEKIDSARHCGLFRASGPVVVENFDTEQLISDWDFEVCGDRYTASSLPGVFSHGRLDEGTALLLETLSTLRFDGAALDFGCGSGVISAVLGRKNPHLDLSLVDNSALALEASRLTLARNELAGRVFASNGLSAVTESFQLIVSNPPFHQGIETKSGMSMAMLAPVRNFLEPGGQLIMVVNRHLPYRSWLQGIFGNCDTLAQNGRFLVLRSHETNQR
jgi:16S rRNA (guanine1207-N2)-methyltransferase